MCYAPKTLLVHMTDIILLVYSSAVGIRRGGSLKNLMLSHYSQVDEIRYWSLRIFHF